MKEVKEGDTIRVHYTGKLPNGEIFDSSKGREPLEFTVGSRTLISGFEKGVIGMKLNETKTIVIPCEEAYGPVREEYIIEVPRAQLPEGDLSVGTMLSTTTPEGEELIFTITQIKNDSAVLDMNHPLAGKDLTFEITIVDFIG